MKPNHWCLTPFFHSHLFLSRKVTLTSLSSDKAAISKSKPLRSLKMKLPSSEPMCECEHGIEISLGKCKTPKYYITVIDAPRHCAFIKNMIIGTSLANYDILIIAMETGEFKAAFTLGVQLFSVAINKMDTTKLGKILGLSHSSPVVNGMVTICRRCLPTWAGSRDGPRRLRPLTLHDTINTIDPPVYPTNKPLALPLQNMNSIGVIGAVPVGCFETGTINFTDAVVILPSATLTKLQEIVHLEESRKTWSGTTSKALEKTSEEQPDSAAALMHESKKGKKKGCRGPYCPSGKHNPEATSHDAEHCWQLHPEQPSGSG
ncbi:elongation factor 1 alpha [Puccinia sorghi]|uniref:Elongation factor 1 alpha n=1 Tax=Puccinia sorghi TaxID=27349 RepID=A0A0L6VBW0_9BASI|nr:elongation factor 1 alpha [Puccinia sorghi]